ncbi:tail fiber domain-containing protein, partial [Candidatus Saccharibacteria bacterium]|nr:tail fiber domain-containing protein [Candidatus Saccharibacteria bacterium]
TTASGLHSTALGYGSVASGLDSTAFGQVSLADGYGATAFGGSSHASGDYAVAFGDSTIASGAGAVAFGGGAEASGDASTAFGSFTTASAFYSTAFGNNTTAGGYTSTAFGDNTTASGDYSTAFGRSTTAAADNSTALGRAINVNNTATNSVGIGLDSTVRNLTQANTLAVVGGTVGLGTLAPTHQLDVSDVTTTNVSQFLGSGGTQCTVVTGTGWSCSSDETLKTNILNVANGLDIIKQIQGVTYNWKSDPTGTQQDGFLAQDIQKILPELVTTDSNGKLSLNKDGIMPFIVEAIKEQNGNLHATNKQLSEQGIKLDNLSTELATLSKTIEDHSKKLQVQKNQIDQLIQTVQEQSKDIENLKAQSTLKTTP